MSLSENSSSTLSWDQERQEMRLALGLRLKALRNERALTLRVASDMAGLAVSTIHKIERGQVSPSFENLIKIARGYSVSLDRLIAEDGSKASTTRLTVTRAGEGRRIQTAKFEYEVLCGSIKNKKIVPLVTEVDYQTGLTDADCEAHAGEELIFVLSGTIELYVEHYELVTLSPGDCAYFDSGLKHGLRALDRRKAKIFWACTDPEHQQHASKKMTPGGGNLSG